VDAKVNGGAGTGKVVAPMGWDTDEKKEILVGLTAALILVVLVALIPARSGLFATQDHGVYRLQANFNRVDGLAVGTPVRIGGVVVGRVEELTLLPDFRVSMTILIDGRYRLPVDSSISVETDGLFGPKSVRIEPGGDEQPLLDGGQFAYVQDPLMVSDLLDLIIAEGRAQRAGMASAEPPAERR
jgi:phospholipid/cholesterol/gamma-HCH transport system substrate-binding protein